MPPQYHLYLQIPINPHPGQILRSHTRFDCHVVVLLFVDGRIGLRGIHK
jgi:hypothetical protein